MRRPVIVINPQATKNMRSEGKKPESPVMMGSASMPAPMQLPAMSKMPADKSACRFHNFSALELHFFLVRADFLSESSKYISVIVDKFKDISRTEGI